MADDKLREAALKPIATIKKPVIAAEKKEEAKTVDAPAAKKETPKAAKKTTAKKTTKKATATKTAAKKTETKAAETKAPAKKPAAKKATPAKTTAKATTKATTKKAEGKVVAKKATAAKKTTATKEAATKTNIVLQYSDKSVTYDTFIENAKNVWQYDMGRKVSEIKTLELYVKPEEQRVYFVVNGEVHSDFGM
ncbi:DUF6465 family protein [Butyrivibrio sp. JL13D10]|uniref:DUF6465 family protein n=1 Tax=Butyrivibrio sp. JL13D10 TaxID=3236815 RepID=UPI0038B4B84D